jgi:DNA-binding FadR family transcriptional regulator
LDGEIESSEQLSVSRTAYREAVRTLAAKGLVSSRPKVGTRVNQQHEWNLLDADVLGWIFQGEPEPEVMQRLFELRSIVEPEAAALAAKRRTQQQLDDMRQALKQMREHTLRTEAGRLADQDFHSALLSASDNPFIISMTRSVTAAVAALTEYKQRVTPLRRDPVPDHERVYDAVAAKDPAKARIAMAELIRLAVMDTPMRRKTKYKKR